MLQDYPKTIAADICAGRYGNDQKEIKKSAERIFDHINSYLNVLDDIRVKTLQEPALVLINLHITLDRIIGAKRISLAFPIRDLSK